MTGEINPCPEPACHIEHFCARCGRELKMSRRVPYGTGFLCVRCAQRKSRPTKKSNHERELR